MSSNAILEATRPALRDGFERLIIEIGKITIRVRKERSLLSSTFATAEIGDYHKPIELSGKDNRWKS